MVIYGCIYVPIISPEYTIIFEFIMCLINVGLVIVSVSAVSLNDPFRQ